MQGEIILENLYLHCVVERN